MNKKIYKGYELMKAIADEEIKENSKIDVLTDYGAYITTIKYKDGQLKWKTGEFNTGFLCSEGSRFELIEDETIDIESIKEVESNAIGDLANEIKDKLNQVIRGLKQQEKRIKKLEDKQ